MRSIRSDGTNCTRNEVLALSVLRSYGDAACYEEMVQTILRGMADGIDVQPEGVLIHHRAADLYMIAAPDSTRLSALVQGMPSGATDVLLHGSYAPDQVEQIRTHFHLRNCLSFVLYAYYGALPASGEDGFDIRPLQMDSLDFVYDHYGHASREYLQVRIAQGVMLGAYVDGVLAAFIGEHVEGSMGLLHVLPEFRRMHLGYGLERAAIRRTMLLGHIPFDQVAIDNAASHALQSRLGMTRSESSLLWLTDDLF